MFSSVDCTVPSQDRKGDHYTPMLMASLLGSQTFAFNEFASRSPMGGEYSNSTSFQLGKSPRSHRMLGIRTRIHQAGPVEITPHECSDPRSPGYCNGGAGDETIELPAGVIDDSDGVANNSLTGVQFGRRSCFLGHFNDFDI